LNRDGSWRGSGKEGKRERDGSRKEGNLLTELGVEKIRGLSVSAW